jgi:hypothetical protein
MGNCTKKSQKEHLKNLCNKHGLEDPDNQVQIEEYMTSSDYQ